MTVPVFVVAIDGFTASGKGTLAAQIAAHYKFSFMDTGLLYRQVGQAVLAQGGDPQDIATAVAVAHQFAQHYRPNQPEAAGLRDENVSQAASQVAAIPGVRDCLLNLQRGFAAAPPPLPGLDPTGAVLDGRDIGTIICPHADVKLFITASPEVRAERRLKQLQSRGIAAMYDHVLQDLKIRDERDRQREVAPTMPAADALILDTSTLSREEVLDRALTLIDKKMAQSDRPGKHSRPSGEA
ncbi:MAG: (d)CMP kinase [Pseudomonadota bacterium]